MTPLDAAITALKAQVDQAHRFYNDMLDATIARYRTMVATHPQLSRDEQVSILTAQLVHGNAASDSREVDGDNGRMDLANQLALMIDREARRR